MANIRIQCGLFPRFCRTDIVKNGEVIYKVWDNKDQHWVTDVSSQQWNQGTMRTEMMRLYIEQEADDEE